MKKQVTNEEVKRYFLLADAMKRHCKKHRKLGLKVLEEEFERELDYLNNLDDYRLNDRITDKVRLARYNSMNWYRGLESLEKAGVWPKMQGSNISLTTKNVPHTAKSIESVIKDSNKVPEELKIKIASIREIATFVYGKFPLIFYPGGEVREKDYNVWARENNEPLCEIYNFDIDDGCSRGVAYCLEGVSEAPVYFGEYK